MSEGSLRSSHQIPRWVHGTERMLTKVTPSLACHPLSTGSNPHGKQVEGALLSYLLDEEPESQRNEDQPPKLMLTH